MKPIMAAISVAAALATPLAFAFPIAVPGTEGLEVLVSSPNHIVATYQGNSAAFSNDLYLERDAGGNPGTDDNTANDLFIFNNHASAVGSTFDLGSFAIGTELVLRLHVNNTGNDFFTGPANRNPDGHTHARVQENWAPGSILVSFEDLFNGPFAYNDLSFSFANTQTTQPRVEAIPEPASIAMLGLGIAFLASRRKKSLV